MTAQTTPRLGLLRPVGTDPFTIPDFAASMMKLDGTPGLTPIANFGALPTGLTSAQHGSVYLQTDNGSMWMWNKPGSAAGSWKKLNTVGMLASANQPSAVSTSSTTLSSGATIVSLNYTAAGGRRVMAFFSHQAIQNSGSYGYSQVGLLVDGSTTASEVSVMSGGSANKNISHRLMADLGTPAAGSAHSLTVKLASLGWAGGGTSSTQATGQLYVWEI